MDINKDSDRNEYIYNNKKNRYNNKKKQQEDAMERIPRAEGRFNKNLTASVRYNDRVFSCITKNISRKGIYLEAIGLNPDTERKVAISLVGDNSLFNLAGEII